MAKLFFTPAPENKIRGRDPAHTQLAKHIHQLTPVVRTMVEYMQQDLPGRLFELCVIKSLVLEYMFQLQGGGPGNPVLPGGRLPQ